MHIHRVLQRLGFNDNEAKIYVAVLRAGEALVSEIARATEIPRSTVQFSVVEMQTKGLLGHYTKRQQTYWVAQNPSHLLADLEERHALLERALPELRSLRQGRDDKPRCMHHEGVSGVTTVLHEVVRAHYTTKICGALAELAELLEPETVTDLFTELRVQHVPVQVLVPPSQYASDLKRHLLPGTHSLRFSEGEGMTTAVTMIYAGRLALIGCSSQWLQAVVHEDAGVATLAGSLFDAAWEQGSPTAR